jgi:hypothetical protein
MFDELEIYTQHGHFFYKQDYELSDVCNAPIDESGVYIIYKLKNYNVDMIYIGSSGKIDSIGKIKHRKGGLFGSLVNGKQFGDVRRISWSRKMKKEKIEAVDVYWYVTYNEKVKDNPLEIEKKLRQRYFEIYGRLPEWNESSEQ